MAASVGYAECTKCGKVTPHRTIEPKEESKGLGPIVMKWECTVCGTRRSMPYPAR